MTAQLIDGVRRSELSANFEIPTHAERAGLRPGDHAQVGVEFNATPERCSGERFWVRVLTNTNGRYVGVVANELVCPDCHGLQLGDRLTFHADHVLNVAEVEQ